MDKKGQVAWQRTDKNNLVSVGSEKKIFLIYRSVLSFSHSLVAPKFGTMKQDLNSIYFLKITLFLMCVISEKGFD